jgi:phosphoribosyl-dephospho-CoA transferase
MDLRRHRLVRLTPAGWRHASTQHVDSEAQRCLAHWSAHDLPLVVATQPATAAGGVVSLGLPAPTRWGRARLALRVALADLQHGSDEFPLLAACEPLLAQTSPAFVALLKVLTRELPDSRVHGSFGWQHLTALAYVHEQSDLDLSIPVADAERADEAVALLTRSGVETPRLDGELCFADGSAVAWREWAAWRAGRVRAILIKRLRGASLEDDTAWLPRATFAEVSA